jgi:hypothetical protein
LANGALILVGVDRTRALVLEVSTDGVDAPDGSAGEVDAERVGRETLQSEETRLAHDVGTDEQSRL